MCHTLLTHPHPSTTQFVRVRGASDEHRHAILLALVARTFRKRTLVFCNTKVRPLAFVVVWTLFGGSPLRRGDRRGFVPTSYHATTHPFTPKKNAH